MVNSLKGFLLEYALSLPPLVLSFEFNPQQITRNRSLTITLGSTPATRGGFDFFLPTETPRVSQGVALEPESFDVEILLDATDRMNDGDADRPLARHRARTRHPAQHGRTQDAGSGRRADAGQPRHGRQPRFPAQ
jgi:hypothetical protein